MTPELAATFKRPFKEQVAFFTAKAKNLIPTSRWDDLWQAEHDRAFMVAGAVKADLLADLYAAVLRAEADGTSLDTFRKDFRAIVEKNGWHGWTGEGTAKGEAWRTRVIYRTNMSASYAAGRWAQLKAADYPLLIYFHGNSQEPREDHLSWNGLILPVDHPFWVSHAPPNGWGCTCYVIGARTMDQAVALGGKPSVQLPPDWQRIDPKTGAPVGIDKGWAYAPGDSVAAAVAEMARKMERWPATIPAAFVRDLPDEDAADRIVKAYRALPSVSDSVRSWAGRVLQPNPEGITPPELLMVGPLLSVERQTAGDKMLALADSLVRDLAGRVTAEDWAELPRLLAENNPREKGGLLVWVIDRGLKGIWHVEADALRGALRIIRVEIDK